MRIEFKYKWINGFGRWYDYAYKQTRMITKEAKQRLKILNFWRQYGLQTATAKDFFKKLERIFPFPIKTIQTDNGSEFHI